MIFFVISVSFWQDNGESEDLDNAIKEEGDYDDVNAIANADKDDTNESEQTNEANGDKASEDVENDNEYNDINLKANEPETVT